jgi:hypothetical protein
MSIDIPRTAEYIIDSRTARKKFMGMRNRLYEIEAIIAERKNEIKRLIITFRFSLRKLYATKKKERKTTIVAPIAKAGGLLLIKVKAK